MEVFMENFIPLILSIFATIILVLAKGLIKKYGSKLDVEIKQRLNELISDLSQQGAAYAEQWAQSKNKMLPEKEVIPGSEKMRKAMEYVAEQIEKHQIDKLTEEQLSKKIEAMLGFTTLNTRLIASPIIEEEGNDENMY